jgi:hypothetical protein
MITASLVLCATGARAEPKEADRLFLEGRELHKAGKLEAACKKFERAHELDNGPGIVANLADCRERFGDPAEAWRLFRDAAARWDNADGAKLARKRAAQLEERLAIVVIGVPEPELRGLVVAINGRRVAPASEIRDAVLPGALEITAKAPGKQRFKRTRTAAAGDTVVVELALEEARAEAPPGGAGAGGAGAGGGSDGGRKRGRVALAIGIGALGVAGLATGVGLGFYANGQYDRITKDEVLCPQREPLQCEDDGQRQINDAQQLARIGTGTAIGGGVLAVAGLVLYLTAPRGVTAAPVVGGGALGIVVGRAF